MKKLLLLISIVYFALATNGQNAIPNGDFETWNSGTYDYPENYPFTSNTDVFYRYQLPFNLVKTTDAHHGTYAVKITSLATSSDSAMGYFLNIDPNDGDPFSWTGGMPYTETPAGIRGYYKYNVASTDSAFMIVVFSKLGSNIGSYFFKMGGIHTTYSLFDFTFNPPLPTSPDSVILAFTSSDIMLYESGAPGSELFIDSVSFTGVISQPALMNGDFELWQSQTLNIPANWYAMSDYGNGINLTTDAAAGDYAIELTTTLGNSYNNPVARSGIISTGYYENTCNCMRGGYPFSNQVDTLAFWYKYTPSANDSAQIGLNFKLNGSSFWWAGKNLPASASYQYIEIPFDTWLTADTVIVQVQSSEWDDTLLSFIGSNLIIDEIHFKSNPLTTFMFNYENNDEITIFPNPSNGKFFVQGLMPDVQRLDIYNVLAEKVFSASYLQQSTSEIDLSTIPKGFYFVKISYKEKTYTKRIVIQ